jgi:hypothetical protein
MFDRRLNSADTSRPSARHAVVLGVVLLVGVAVAGAALGGVTAAESQSSPVEISNWTDLQAINDNQTTLGSDYVLVNDLNKSTAGYNAVVLNQTATEFTESVFFDEGESRVNLTRTPVAALLSSDEGLNLTVVDSANGTIERENNSSFSSGAVTYTTPTERFVGFSPIGPSFSEPFSGSFDGQGNTIRDLIIDRPADDEVGLFGFSEGTIEQVTVANATITGSHSVGGVVGESFQGTVSNSSASGAVTGSSSVGGLVGENSLATVSTSSASATVTGSEVVGGLVGENRRGTVSTSSASATVTGSSSVGGLVGESEGTVSTSSASGAVTGSEVVGGLVGGNVDGGTVNNSSASGAVTGSENVGGLVGENSFATVNNSLASGAVNGSSRVGGRVGENFGTVSASSASGAVTGSSSVGGLVGENVNGMVSNSSASGDVNGSSRVGGLVGFTFQGTVSESFAAGAVTGSSNLGGLVGQLGLDTLNPGREAILRDSYYDTQTTGQQAAVGTIEEGNGTAELRGEVAGLPTSQMQGASAAQNMGALDFTSTWRVVTDPPGYPELRGPSDAPDPGPPNVTMANLSIAGQGDNATITEGNYDVSVELSHDGGPNGTVPINLTIGTATANKTVSLNASETTTVTFENATGGLPPAVYNVTVSAVDASLTGELTLSVPVGDNTDPATDTDDDSLLEDTDGDGSFTIFDVQTFFVEFQSDPVQTAPALFNFDGSGDGAVTIFDVQALFLELLD